MTPFRMDALCLSLAVLAAGCGSSRSDNPLAESEGDGGTGGDTEDGDVSDGDGDESPIFDVADGSDSDKCEISEDGNGVGPCDYEGPPDSFEADIQWTWSLDPEGHRTSCTTLPLVANLTDDNDDGKIDLCDTPDVVVLVYDPDFQEHGLGFGDSQWFYILDGATGNVHARSEINVNVLGQPALGDIDDDGIPEIVTAIAHETSPGAKGRLGAFEHDGTHKWTTTFEMSGGAGAFASSIGLADLDNDGDVEIYAGPFVFDHEGNHLWTAPEYPAQNGSPVAVDLDGDGDLELVVGSSAYHHDGTQMWTTNVSAAAYPQVADLDGDGLPEVSYATKPITIVNHDGSHASTIGNEDWTRPITIHDIDGDDSPDILAMNGSQFAVFQSSGGKLWDATVADPSGPSGGTAFDFLGDGTAEAMYADEERIHVFGPGGVPKLQAEHISSTGLEYPLVADVDNDGSAEIVVVTDRGWGKTGDTPTVQVIRDAEDRWVPARRIWNQHTYHVTNVNEDGTIPQFERPHWLQNNTFRTQAQISTDGGSACLPEG